MKKTLLLSLIAVLISAKTEKPGGDKIHFAFELSRHGARAPTSVSSGYSVSAGMLTAQGMRQRFLLGAYNMKRYSEDYQLIDLEEGPEQVLMMSTEVNRTIQSGYSEYMGMFPPNPKKSIKLTMPQVKAINGVSAPPFTVRDSVSTNEKLLNLPLPQGFVQLPIYNHLEENLTDDLDMYGCDYVNTVDSYRFPDEATYSSVEWLKDDLREPIGNAFNLTKGERDSMSFMDLYGYCDVIQSNEFEGLGAGYNYTLDQLNQINQTVLATLVLPLTDPVLSRNMYVSKMMRLPLTMMTRVVDGVLGGAEKPKVKFLSYSTHDWTVAQLLLFFDADNGQSQVIPFASNVIIELHSSDECSTNDCFWVEVIYNGVILAFADDCKEATRCTYSEFMEMIQFKGFVNTGTKYDHECAKKWSPKQTSVQQLLQSRFMSKPQKIKTDKVVSAANAIRR